MTVSIPTSRRAPTVAAAVLLSSTIFAATASAATREGRGPTQPRTPPVCCGFTQSAFSGKATWIATNGGQEYILDNSTGTNGHTLYQNVSGRWVTVSSPGGTAVALDTYGHVFLLTSGGTLYWDSYGTWSTFTNQTEKFSYIGDDACNCGGSTEGSVEAVGTTVRNGKGYAAYYCATVASEAGTCGGPMFGPPDNPTDNYKEYMAAPTAGSAYPEWAVNGDNNVYQTTSGSVPWVEAGSIKVLSLSSNKDGTYAVTTAGALENWNGTAWVSVSAPPNLTNVSVGPNHVWVLDSSGDIYWK